MADKLIPLCKLFENTSTAGQRYFSGNLTYTTKLLIFPNEGAKEGEPTWEVFLAERTPPPHASGNTGVLKGRAELPELDDDDPPVRKWVRKG